MVQNCLVRTVIKAPALAYLYKVTFSMHHKSLHVSPNIIIIIINNNRPSFRIVLQTWRLAASRGRCLQSAGSVGAHQSDMWRL